jgi:hypothetical protein
LKIDQSPSFANSIPLFSHNSEHKEFIDRKSLAEFIFKEFGQDFIADFESRIINKIAKVSFSEHIDQI